MRGVLPYLFGMSALRIAFGIYGFGLTRVKYRKVRKDLTVLQDVGLVIRKGRASWKLTPYARIIPPHRALKVRETCELWP